MVLPEARSEAVNMVEYLALGSLATMMAMEIIKLTTLQPTAPTTKVKIRPRSSTG